MGNNMNLEIIGPPGPGKTPLVNNLVLYLNDGNKKVFLIKKIGRHSISNLSYRDIHRLPIEIIKKIAIMLFINCEKNRFNYKFWILTFRSWPKVIAVTFFSSGYNKGLAVHLNAHSYPHIFLRPASDNIFILKQSFDKP